MTKGWCNRDAEAGRYVPRLPDELVAGRRYRDEIMRLRRGDEFHVEWPGGACWARVIGLQVFEGLISVDGLRVGYTRPGGEGIYVVGLTTMGRVVTTHERWVTDTRAENDHALRASWDASLPPLQQETW